MTEAATNHRSLWWVGLGALLTLFICALFFFSRMDNSQIPRYEVFAIGQLRNIGQEQEAFRQAHKGCFANDLDQLPNIRKDRYHYIYTMESVTANDKPCATRYVVTASPEGTDRARGRYFLTDETGKIHFEMTHPASTASPILQ